MHIILSQSHIYFWYNTMVVINDDYRTQYVIKADFSGNIGNFLSNFTYSWLRPDNIKGEVETIKANGKIIINGYLETSSAINPLFMEVVEHNRNWFAQTKYSGDLFVPYLVMKLIKEQLKANTTWQNIPVNCTNVIGPHELSSPMRVNSRTAMDIVMSKLKILNAKSKNIPKEWSADENI